MATAYKSNPAPKAKIKKAWSSAVLSVFHGKSWMDRERSKNTGKLKLKDLAPELNETNAPPAAVQSESEGKQ